MSDNLNNEPVEVILTRQLQLVGGAFTHFHTVGSNSMPRAFIEMDRELRRYLWRAIGFSPCDELSLTECTCSELEPPRPITPDHPCTGDWRGCQACNEGHLTYADGIGEYDICKACHWDGKCLDEEMGMGACNDDGYCVVYPERHAGFRVSVGNAESFVLYQDAASLREAEEIADRLSTNLDTTRYQVTITNRNH